MVVVLETESEDMKFFFQGCDELKVLLYQKSLMPKRDILRVDAVSLLFECCAGVTDLVVIGHGGTPKERPSAHPTPSPHGVHHINRFGRDDLSHLGHKWVK